MTEVHEIEIQIYYEDTDHSGLVYHANYLKYFERAREHFLGTDELRRMLREDGLGFVVYRAHLAYRRGAEFGDRLRIETRARSESPYRATFEQRALRQQDGELLVTGHVDLVLVDASQRPAKFPEPVLEKIRAAADPLVRTPPT